MPEVTRGMQRPMLHSLDHRIEPPAWCLHHAVELLFDEMSGGNLLDQRLILQQPLEILQ